MADSEPRKVFVTPEEYHDLIRQLAQKITLCPDFQVRQVIAIARGGLFPGEVLSRCFNVPLAIISARSYPPEGTQQEERIVFSRDLATTHPLIRVGILVVDELTETGLTFREAINWLVGWYGLPRDQTKTAALWHKTKSRFVPDFYIQRIGPDSSTGLYPWLVTPQEQREFWLPPSRP